MHILITGGASGLGRALVNALQPTMQVTVWDVTEGVDVSDWCSVARAARNITQPLDILVNCAGINSINWFEELMPEDFIHTLHVNALGIFYCTRSLLPHLYGGGTVCNITSNAAHLPMTASLPYNASKAAAHMMTKQMAHELGPRHGITVFAVAPNKLADTGMSRYTAQRVAEVRNWTNEQVQQKQLAALPAREETPVEVLAEFIAFLLSKKERHRYLQGCIIPYGGPA